ncbi:MAG: cytochrome b/b6 domain-containing protein [Alcanivoracaceae bacterium]|nr:cytochrome b/b6 domain-containing protein [Alcanivoracaceae bacterium]
MSDNSIKVWDVLVRIFHWSLVIGFIVAYLSEDDYQEIHIYAGYTVLGLVIFRLIWGFIGSHYARFNNFVVKPSVTLSYLKDIKNHSAKRYIGHNPAGAMMILALIFSLIMTTVFGLMLYGAEEFSGPLAGLMTNISDSTAHNFEEIHEFFANFSLFLIILHVLGVVLAGYQHKENLVLSMINGRKKANEEESPHE